MSRNIALYPWFKFFGSMLFWQAIWFLFFQEALSASEAILLYAAFDIATTVLEVPSGYLSDRVGRRLTLILSALASVAGMLLILLGDAFWIFALAQVFLGAGAALVSGTDSALLYESLAEEGREGEIERCEILAWRASFTALAISAVTGGGLMDFFETAPFLASALAGMVGVGIAVSFREPPHKKGHAGEGGWLGAPDAYGVLGWIFCLSVSMYVFSHVPFVFGQPFILEALESVEMSADAPLVSGAVTAAMMVVSVATSWAAPAMRRTMGLSALLLFAFAMQIGLIAGLTISGDVLAIALLLLRMVPDSLSKPFILARIQPLLGDAHRATYLSMQSLAGRLVLSGTLVVFSFDASSEAAMSFTEMQPILFWYATVGLMLLIALGATRGLARER
ncbi:MAG: MFS transporter [Pseudomonadota bacterium]